MILSHVHDMAAETSHSNNLMACVGELNALYLAMVACMCMSASVLIARA